MENKNTNKLIFLHGSGYNKDSYPDIINKIKNYFNAELITFNAPIEKGDKINSYMWFNKFIQNNRKDAVEKDYLASINFIKEKIKNLDCPSENIILLGHSQGGTMAISVGLELKIKKVISICADMPYNLNYKNLSNTKIDWYECKYDGYISKERQNSYKLLEKINANLNFKILENSSHREFSDDIKQLIKENLF